MSTVFIYLFLAGERYFFFDRLQVVPIKGKIVFCTLQNLIMPTRFTIVQFLTSVYFHTYKC